MRFLLTLLLIGTWMSFQPHGRGAEWSRFRGPLRNGISSEPGTLGTNWASWFNAPVWERNVGTGFTSVAISSGRLFVAGNTNNTDTVFCLNVTNGANIWSHSFPTLIDPNLYEGGPSATPTIDGDRVYSISKAGDLFCFNVTNGTIHWQINITNAFQLRRSIWGYASSPLIMGERMYLNAAGGGLCLNKNDGSRIWMSQTNTSTSGSRNGYATPVSYDAEGTPALLNFSFRDLFSVRQSDGTVLWRIPWTTQFDINIADPILYKGGILISSYDRPTVMLRVTNNVVSTNWISNPLFGGVYLSAGVVISNLLFTFIGDVRQVSYFMCVDLDTGMQKWIVPQYASFEQPPYGSVISVDNKVLALSGSGELLLFMPSGASDANRPMQRKYILGGRCWAPLVFNNGSVYARNSAGTLRSFAAPWTPEIAPTLSIQRTAPPPRVVVSWPASNSTYQLQAAPFGGPSLSFSAVTNSPATNGSLKSVTNDASGGGKVFRLIKP